MGPVDITYITDLCHVRIAISSTTVLSFWLSLDRSNPHPQPKKSYVQTVYDNDFKYRLCRRDTGVSVATLPTRTLLGHYNPLALRPKKSTTQKALQSQRIQFELA